MAFKVGSQLIEEEKDQQPLNTQEGDVAQMGSPGAALQAGATEGQAKMAQTPQAMKGLSSKVALKAKDTLAGAKRLKQPQQQKTQQTEEEIAYTQRLQKLGSFGANIQRLVDQSVEEAAQKDVKLEVNEQFVKGLDKDQQSLYTSGVDAINAAISAGQDPVQAVADLKNQFKDHPNAEAMMEGIERDMAGAVAGQIAAGTIDAEDVNINTLFNAGIMEPEDLGLSEDELTKGLGSNWINMTPKQLSAAVDRLNAIKYGESDQLIGMLNDPYISASQKEDIKDKLWEMGYSGALQREADVDVMARQVESSGLVNFGGELRDIDELLDDKEMENTLSDYLEGDDAYKAEFAKQNPELAAYLNKNAEAFQSALDAVGDSEKTLNELKEENKKAVTFGDKEDELALSDESLSAIFPDYEPGSFTTQKLVSDNPLMKWLKDTPGEARDVVESLNGLADIDPDLVRQAMDMSAGDPKKLRALITEIQKDPEGLQEAARLNTEFKKLSPSSSIDDLVSYMFDGDLNAGELEEKLAEAKAASGYDKKAGEIYDGLTEVFDRDGDGTLDDPAEVYDRLRRKQGKDFGLEDMLGGSTAVQRAAGILGQDVPKTGRVAEILGDAVSGTRDTLSKSEAREKLSEIDSIDDLSLILDSGVKLDDDAKKFIMDKGMKLIEGTDTYNSMLKTMPSYNAVLQMDTTQVAEGGLANTDMIEKAAAELQKAANSAPDVFTAELLKSKRKKLLKRLKRRKSASSKIVANKPAEAKSSLGYEV